MNKLLANIPMQELEKAVALRRREAKLLIELNGVRQELGLPQKQWEALAGVMAKHGKPMKLGLLTEKALKAGVHTNAKRPVEAFHSSLAQKPKVFKRLSWGVWTLKA